MRRNLEQASLSPTPQKQMTSDDTPVLNKSKQVSSALDMNAGRKMGNQAASTTSEQTRPAPAMQVASQLQATRPETPGVPGQRCFDSSKLGFTALFGERNTQK
ncbi:hypothetical protein MRX96_042012 [Rhipicephalus microplus]